VHLCLDLGQLTGSVLQTVVSALGLDPRCLDPCCLGLHKIGSDDTSVTGSAASRNHALGRGGQIYAYPTQPEQRRHSLAVATVVTQLVTQDSKWSPTPRGPEPTMINT
jgi:hypothetical protein